MFKNKIKKILSAGLALTMIASTLVPTSLFAKTVNGENISDKEETFTINNYHYYNIGTDTDESFVNGPYANNPFIIPFFWTEEYAEKNGWSDVQPVEMEAYRTSDDKVTYCLDLGKAMPDGTAMTYRPEKVTTALNRVIIKGYPNMKGEDYGISDAALEWATAVALKIVDGNMYSVSGERFDSDLTIEAFNDGETIEYTYTKEAYPDASDEFIEEKQAEADKILDVVKELVAYANDENVIVDNLEISATDEYVIPAGQTEYIAGPFNVSIDSNQADKANLAIKVEGADDIVLTDAEGNELTAEDLAFGTDFYIKGNTSTDLTLKVTAYADGIEVPIQYYYGTDEKAEITVGGEPYQTDYQRMYVYQTVTLQDETEINIKVTPDFDVTITKTDADNQEAITGAEISVFDSEGKEVSGSPFTTNSEGKIVVKDLVAGTYTYQETKAPTGYKLDSAKHSFTIAEDGAVSGEIAFTNEKNSVVITKTDLTGTEGVPGATIEITDSEGTPIEGSPFVTDENGQIVLEKLPAGSYTFKETIAPDGYILNTEEATFTVNEDGTVEGTTTLKNAPTSVTITKTDAEDKDSPIAGANVMVYDADGNAVSETPFVTDENGEITITKLVPGTYTFKETKAPAGYKLNPNTFTFTIAEDGSVSGETSFTDEQNKTTITKVDLVSGEGVPGAIIEIKDSDGNPINGSPFTTDEDGKISISKLPAGTYTFKETVAPDGYILNTEEATFTVNEDGTISGTTILKNEPTKVEITKKDATQDSKVLKGATIQIKDSTGKVVAEGTTDENGKLTVYALPAGDYTYVEVKAPNGYALNSTPVKFSIAKDGTVTGEMTLLDNPTKLTVSKVDAETSKGVAGATLTIRDANGKDVISGTTDKNGNITIAKLNAGDYTLVETKAPAGYVLNTTPVKFTVNADGSIEGTTVIKNNPTKVTLEKVNEEGKGLEGAVFEVRYGNTVKGNYTTGKDGKVEISKLPVGEYTFKEVTAPDGYAVDTKTYSFTIAEDGSVTGTTKITDKQIVVTLYKKDLTTGEVLEGATLVVKDSKGKLVAEEKTDKDGKITLTGLTPGQYTLTESKAPEGYQLNKTSYIFTIKEDGTIEGDTTIYDKKLATNPGDSSTTTETTTDSGKGTTTDNEEVQTGDNSNNLAAKAGMIALAAVAAGIGVISLKKKKEHND